MDQENFEDIIRSKFEGAQTPPPNKVWQGVEAAINEEKVAHLTSENEYMRTIAAAAVLLMAFLLGALYHPKSEEVRDGSSFNALLESGGGFGNFLDASFSGTINDITVLTEQDQQADAPYEYRQAPVQLLVADAKQAVNSQSEIALFELPTGKDISLELAHTSPEIYRYVQAGNYTQPNGNKTADKTERKLWAGVEAGAGSFDSNISNAALLSGATNPATLASAISTNRLVNPSASLSKEAGSAMATSIGLDFGVELGEKWTLESGLAYTNVNSSGTASVNVLDIYTINNPLEPTIDEFGFEGSAARVESITVEEQYDYEVEINNNVQFASIPVKAGYALLRDNKFSLRLNAGLAANYLVNGNISDPSSQIVAEPQQGLYNEWSFDGIGGVELGYTIFKKVDLTLEPNYRHAFTPINNSATNPARFLVQTGLKYSLK